MKKLFGYLLPNLVLVQIFTWIMLYSCWVFYLYNKFYNPVYAFAGGLTAFLSYVIATYTNYHYLIPRILRKKGPGRYIIGSLLFMVALVFVRMGAEYLVLLPIMHKFYDMGMAHFVLDTVTTLLAFLFGALLRVSIDYIQLAQQQKDLIAKQTATELKLLKAQVQPHFLFNTLNNIYYLALSGSNKAPEAIARLSDTMRYFTDEAHKDKVALATEIQLIMNYMELEKLRMPHSLDICFDRDGVNTAIMVPPMLLMPLIENIYKHGIDKTMAYNKVKIALHAEDNRIVFTTSNTVPETAMQVTDSKKGLQNLRERLQLLYGKDYVLHVDAREDRFDAMLKFPVT